ncbi:hypothetical protein C8R44DRAFT_752726 [Mycena epipterygia]|nr:hypothetical protein C8R44DRAFT_752726 [Mycena epipterygia]
MPKAYGYIVQTASRRETENTLAAIVIGGRDSRAVCTASSEWKCEPNSGALGEKREKIGQWPQIPAEHTRFCECDAHGEKNPGYHEQGYTYGALHWRSMTVQAMRHARKTRKQVRRADEIRVPAPREEPLGTRLAQTLAPDEAPCMPVKLHAMRDFTTSSDSRDEQPMLKGINRSICGMGRITARARQQVHVGNEDRGAEPRARQKVHVGNEARGVERERRDTSSGGRETGSARDWRKTASSGVVSAQLTTESRIRAIVGPVSNQKMRLAHLQISVRRAQALEHADVGPSPPRKRQKEKHGTRKIGGCGDPGSNANGVQNATGTKLVSIKLLERTRKSQFVARKSGKKATPHRRVLVNSSAGFSSRSENTRNKMPEIIERGKALAGSAGRLEMLLKNIILARQARKRFTTENRAAARAGTGMGGSSVHPNGDSGTCGRRRGCSDCPVCGRVPRENQDDASTYGRHRQRSNTCSPAGREVLDTCQRQLGPASSVLASASFRMGPGHTGASFTVAASRQFSLRILEFAGGLNTD